jgi:hypothetical protein
MKDKIKNYTVQFIKEIIPVIVGILIALFIDNWNSERKDKAYINQVFLTINNELKESKEDIKTTIPQQQALIDSLEYYADNKNVTILDIVKKSNGVFIPQVKINGWKSVSNTKIDLINYEKVASLSNIEALKETLNNKSEFLMSFMYSNINQTDKNIKQTSKMILLDIIQTEKMMEKNIAVFEENNISK